MKYFVTSTLFLQIFASLVFQIFCQSCIEKHMLTSFSENYNGTITKSVNGLRCIAWNKARKSSGVFNAPIRIEGKNSIQNVKHRYCRAWGSSKDISLGPWCFVERKGEIMKEPCFKRCDLAKEHACYWLKDLPIDNRLAYLGNTDKTIDNKPCFRWFNTFQSKVCRAEPMLTRLVDKNVGTKFDEALHRPWCFTNKNNTEWQYCFPICEDLYKCIGPSDASYYNYEGKVDKTSNGQPCDSWSRHGHKGLSHNYCRNFGRTPVGPWCFVKGLKELKEPCFKDCADRGKLYCVGTEKGVDYMGTVSKTKSNHACLRWDDKRVIQMSVKERSGLESKQFGYNPQDRFELWMASNSCRNPDGSLSGPWCYYVDKANKLARENCFTHCTDISIVVQQETNRTIFQDNEEDMYNQQKALGPINWFAATIPLIGLGCFSWICCQCICFIYCKRALLGGFTYLMTYHDRQMLKKAMKFVKHNPPGMWQRDAGRQDYYNPTEEELESFDKLRTEIHHLRKIIHMKAIRDRVLAANAVKMVAKAAVTGGM